MEAISGCSVANLNWQHCYLCARRSLTKRETLVSSTAWDSGEHGHDSCCMASGPISIQCVDTGERRTTLLRIMLNLKFDFNICSLWRLGWPYSEGILYPKNWLLGMLKRWFNGVSGWHISISTLVQAHPAAMLKTGHVRNLSAGKQRREKSNNLLID